MKFNFEKISVFSAEKNFYMIQGWVLSEKSTRENIRITSGECYCIKRVCRQDVAVAHQKGEEDYRCGFEILIEYPHNAIDYTIEIDDGIECLKENIKFCDLFEGNVSGSIDKANLYSERLSIIEFYESEGINYNIELIAWNAESDEFVIRGWEFAKTTGKSNVGVSGEEVKRIKCSRRDVREFFASKSIEVDETCGFEIYFKDLAGGIDVIFEDEHEKLVIHLGEKYLKKITKYFSGSALTNNKVIGSIKKYFENKKRIARYGKEGLLYKQIERETNLEEDGLNRTTYSYEKISIPLTWVQMQRKQPRIDVIIAIKDVEQRLSYIKKLLECFANQKYSNYNIVLVGKQNELQQVNAIAHMDVNSVVSNSEKKLDLYKDALTASSAEYFLFVNQEDYVEEDFLASYVEQINMNPDKTVFYSNYDVDLEGELIFPVIRKDRYQQENLEYKLVATLFYRKRYATIEAIEKLNEAMHANNILGSTRIYYHYRMIKDAFDDSIHSKAIAFYLPQFHENEENNKWWGEGFTEWTNVRRAVPMFENHNQPRIPADLGYYDLVEDKSVEYKQVELAKKYGVYGFCFYYYWFAGKRLLRKPFDQFVENKELNLPYCICWANETWSRRWNGDEKEVLMKQVHNARTDKRFIYSVMPLFRDERYIRVNGKPLLLIYRIELFPKPAQTIAKWRELCKKEGIGDIHVALVQSFGMVDHRIYGADSSVEFPPHKIQASEINNLVLKNGEEHEGKIYSYEEVVKNQMIVQERDYTLFPGSMLGWDNTARRMKAANVFHEYTPKLFKQWLTKNYMYTRIYNSDSVMFINAWNEWAEGTYLEPDQKYGTSALEIVREVVKFK